MKRLILVFFLFSGLMAKSQCDTLTSATFTAITTNSVNVSFFVSGGNWSSFNVSLYDSATGFVAFNIPSLTTIFFTASGLTPNRTYILRVFTNIALGGGCEPNGTLPKFKTLGTTLAYTPMLANGYSYKRVSVDSTFHLPLQDTSLNRGIARAGALVQRPQDSSLYAWNGLNWDAYAKRTYVDTKPSYGDVREVVSDSIAGKLNISDTASMLLPYRNQINTVANSTISGIALNGNLADLTATNSTLTFSGAYNGSTSRNIGLNLGNANTWTALQTFANKIQTSGNITKPSWGANGANFETTASIYTDNSTIAGGNVALNAVNSFGIPTLTSTNANVTNTIAANVYIAGAPTVSGTTIITNPFSLYVNSGSSYFGGNVTSTGSVIAPAHTVYGFGNASSVNYELGRLTWNTSRFTISSERGGTGLTRSVYIVSGLGGGSLPSLEVGGAGIFVTTGGFGQSNGFAVGNGLVVTSTAQYGLGVLSGIYATGTGSYRAVYVSPYLAVNTATGTKLLMDVGYNTVSGSAIATHITKFSVSEAGLTTLTGKLLVNQNVDAGFTGADINGTVRIQNTLTATKYQLPALNTPPASSTDIGNTGEIRWSNGFVYLCVATNTWQRAALSTF